MSILGHKMFAGNQSDSKSLTQMIQTMQAIASDSENSTPLVIMDSGMAGKENLAELRAKGIRYLVNDRRPSRNKYQEEFFRKSAGVARFAFNWALAEWQQQYADGGKPNYAGLQKQPLKAADRNS